MKKSSKFTAACAAVVLGSVAFGETLVAATDGNPKFRSVVKGDYRIRSSSSCLNAGDNTLWDGVRDPVDLDGTPRIRNGIVDIGCFEGDQSGLLLLVR